MVLKYLLVAFLIGAASADMGKQPFVVNGTDATIAEFPYMIALLYSNSFSCGGSILNTEWVLTAGKLI